MFLGYFLIRHHHGMYLTDADWNPDLGRLLEWKDNGCLSHQNMHWRFDGKYLRNELGTYLARKVMNADSVQASVHGKQSYWVRLNWPKRAGKLSNVGFNDDRLFWEFDPVTNLLGYPHNSIPRYLTRWCTDNQNNPKQRDCHWRQLAKPKMTDNVNTTNGNEEVEQRFSFDYQGDFLSLT